MLYVPVTSPLASTLWPSAEPGRLAGRLWLLPGNGTQKPRWVAERAVATTATRFFDRSPADAAWRGRGRMTASPLAVNRQPVDRRAALARDSKEASTRGRRPTRPFADPDEAWALSPSGGLRRRPHSDRRPTTTPCDSRRPPTSLFARSACRPVFVELAQAGERAARDPPPLGTWPRRPRSCGRAPTPTTARTVRRWTPAAGRGGRPRSGPGGRWWGVELVPARS